MAVQIPSFIQNAPHGSNPNAPSSSGSSSNPKNNMLRNILFIIAILVIGGGAVYYFMFYQKDDNANENTNLVVTANTNDNVNTNSSQNLNVINNSNNNINVTNKILDCGNDINCLVQASEDCTPSKISYTTTMQLGVQQTTTSYFELEKSSNNKCNLYLRTDKIDLVFPDSIPQETVDEQNEFYDSLEGLDGTCEFSTTDLKTVLTNWKNGDFDSGEVKCQLSTTGSECETTGGDFGLAECSGTYFEKLSNPDFNSNVNTNTSSNSNSTLSVNTIGNLNVNTNLNTSEGDNSNINTDDLVYGDIVVDGEVVKMFADLDNDSLMNFFESFYGTDVNNKDTDSDGYDDYTEILSCYNPISSGKINSQYYKNTYCPNQVKKVVEIMAILNKITDEQINQKYNKYIELCDIWSDFSSEVLDAIINGGDLDELYTINNQVYNSSCEKATVIYDSGEIDDLLENSEYYGTGFTSAEDFCYRFSGDIKEMCGAESYIK